MRVVAIFGPTAAGKTAAAIALAELLRGRGEDPVAISCDALQIYRGLEVLSGAATAEQRAVLEHRLLGFLPLQEEFSAGRFAELARAEIDGLLAQGRRPIVVGGTGLYMRAALAELDLRPPVPEPVRSAVERELSERGPAALHAELPEDVADRVHPNDRKRIARATELIRVGAAPPERSDRLWTARLRHPTLLVGLAPERGRLDERIDERVEAMVAAGVAEEVRSAEAEGPSRTARAALGYEQLLAGDVEAVKTAHRRYARRQLTWMAKMADAVAVDPGERGPRDVAGEILGHLADA